MLYIFWWLVWYISGKDKAIRIENGMIFYLSSNIPFGAQGVYCGIDKAFVKRVFYTYKGKIIPFEAIHETDEVIRHEFCHNIQRKRLGFVGFWATIIWAYICFWKSHDQKPLEREAELYEKGELK